MTALSTRPEPGQPWRPVLFDMDGTLIDSAPAILGRLRETLTEFGVTPPDEAALRLFIGPPMHVTLAHFLPAEQVETARTFYRGLSHRDGLSNQNLYPGIKTALAELAGAGIPLAIASSKSQDEVQHSAEHFGIAQYFEGIAGSSLERQDKADVIRFALSMLESPTTHAPLMVGDRSWDIAGAEVVGIPTALVTWGYSAPEEAERALVVIDTESDLVSFIRNSN
jgi:phosphoglycolate phosphatase